MESFAYNKNSTLHDYLMSDFYHFKMLYCYWNSNKHTDHAVFEVYFRDNPFHGEFTIFCGLRKVLDFIANFKLNDRDVAFLKTVLPVYVPDEFYIYLLSLNLNIITVHSIKEGSVVFPNLPLLTVEGPLAIVQLLETPILNFVNFASLIATNAAHFRLNTKSDVSLVEFGARRAQGPDGALSASLYAYIGGFDATSYTVAARHYGIPINGTLAHAFISSFSNTVPHFPTEGTHSSFIPLDCSKNAFKSSVIKDITADKLYQLALNKRDDLIEQIDLFKCHQVSPNDSELFSFIHYCYSFPDNFVALIDTYNVLKSGVLNFCAAALAIYEHGYKAVGLRIDSGDLSFLSKKVRSILRQVSDKFNVEFLKNVLIIASNSLSIDSILSLEKQQHEINVFGVGNEIVTSPKQSSLGLVYKLVQINGVPTMKVTEDSTKCNVPYKKSIFRIFGKDNVALMDVMVQFDDKIRPVVGERFLCRHPFNSLKLAYVVPFRVKNLNKIVYQNGKSYLTKKEMDAKQYYIKVKNYAKKSLSILREDHKRMMFPTPYKVSLSSSLYNNMHELYLLLAPIRELD